MGKSAAAEGKGIGCSETFDVSETTRVQFVCL